MGWGGCGLWFRKQREWCLLLWGPALVQEKGEEEQHPQEEEEQLQQQYHKQTIVREKEGRGMVLIDKRWMMVMKGLKEGWGIAAVNIKYGK